MYCGWKEKQLRQKLHSQDSSKNPDKWLSKIEGTYCINPKWAMRQRGHYDYYTLRKYYERDAAYLGLIKAFLQDCPQLILQLFILAVRDYQSLNEPSIGKLLWSYFVLNRLKESETLYLLKIIEVFFCLKQRM